MKGKIIMFDLKYIAKLSKLDFDYVKKFESQMLEIISLADEILLQNLEELPPVISNYCDLRTDIPKAFNSQSLLNDNACENCFTVPKII